MNLLQRYLEFIKSNDLFPQSPSPQSLPQGTLRQERLLLAVSGGVDSVVLCELCHQAGSHFAIAHCNFQLRGEESERDEQFVRSVGEKYGVETYVQRFDTKQYAEEKKLSIQVAARELRYNWFNGISASYILTAHHADDNIETMLMNFFKGTGISGLHGILPKQNKIVRPLLFAYNDENKAFAEENKLAYVEDSSNSSDKYTRNYFRNQLIPAVEKVFPAVKENLAQNINRFREIEMLYEQAIQLHKKKLVERKGNEYHIPVLRLQKTRPLETVLYEIIKEFGFTSSRIKEVAGLLDSESGKYIASPTHRIIKNRSWLIISPNSTTQASIIVIEEKDKIVEFDNGTLQLEIIQDPEFKIQNNPNIACLDASQIQLPLLLRKWGPGDYFYPLGMKKKKKLSRFFIDQKLSLPEKENTWIVEMNKKIIWVIGRRIDERVKVTDTTRQILLLSFRPS